MALVGAADNTDCTGTGMRWYIDLVGETPCETYENLRQICDSQFTVDKLDVNTPPDYCDDQVSSCCCNTIAFSLSMLHMSQVCQQNISTTTGYDAGVGAYQLYLNGSATSTRSCPNPLTRSLPTDIQSAVCNEKLKINDDIYKISWDDGSCAYTRDLIIKDNIAANNNSFTKCSTINVTSSTSASG
ncbi:hypothetical protein FB45DRAFT_750098 [Roridomyces roridus]|uniref:Uncharacterized protein n=1 Tax=Roridomyces roridus TaxID=1738132 RepID=A0AAD7BNM5_9AGAR|nr:hypothetical protein FB45DRAFT_750098 [Roridomyces roridus]